LSSQRNPSLLGLMHNPPEDIIQYKRNRMLYKEHLKRVRSQNALIDSTVPKSLGLKHLQTRAKKKQLMEDRSQLVAKDNKLLMERMTAIMSTDHPPQEHVHGSSLNERERKIHVYKINKNNEVMLERLHAVQPILSAKKMEDDFEKHKKISGYLKKKRYGAATLKPLSTQPKFGGSTSTFDAQSYISQFGPESDNQSPITSMAEFRKAVISSKRMGSTGSSIGTMKSSSQSHLATSQRGGVDDVRGSPKKDIRFEMTHEPS